MGSEEKPSIRFKRRFGFNGPPRRRDVQHDTVDNFRDSMRRKELSSRVDHETLGLLDHAPELLDVSFEPSSGLAPSRLRMRRLAVISAFWSGVILLLSGYLNSFAGPFSLGAIIHGSSLLSAFELPLTLVLVLVVFGIPAVSLWRGRRTLLAEQHR